MTRFVAISLPSYDTWQMRSLLTLVLLLGLTVLSPAAKAFDLEESLRELHPQYQAAPLYQVTQNGMSLAQATESVRRRTGGRIVSAQTRIQGGREVHYIKVLTKDGKVKTHKVNGRRR
ncbi:MAG: hypothetical protein KJO46_00900 [Gammaproteobacteria bacterium]|nr:hypothetical protein [Gammaproteobacteria bacterium]